MPRQCRRQSLPVATHRLLDSSSVLNFGGCMLWAPAPCATACETAPMAAALATVRRRSDGPSASPGWLYGSHSVEPTVALAANLTDGPICRSPHGPGAAYGDDPLRAKPSTSRWWRSRRGSCGLPATAAARTGCSTRCNSGATARHADPRDHRPHAPRRQRRVELLTGIEAASSRPVRRIVLLDG